MPLKAVIAKDLEGLETPREFYERSIAEAYDFGDAVTDIGGPHEAALFFIGAVEAADSDPEIDNNQSGIIVSQKIEQAIDNVINSNHLLDVEPDEFKFWDGVFKVLKRAKINPVMWKHLTQGSSANEYIEAVKGASPWASQSRDSFLEAAKVYDGALLSAPKRKTEL